MKRLLIVISALLAANAWGDAGNWKVPRWWAFLSAPDAVKKVVDGKCSGHVQGMCVTSNAFYFSFHNQIVKTDWKGRFLKRAEVPRHGGDPCCHDGKLYVPVCTSGFNSKLKRGAVSKNFIYVFDAGLKLLAKHHIPELEYGAGGIAVRDGHFFVVGGRPKDLAGNTVYEYDGNFKFVRRHEVAFEVRVRDENGAVLVGRIAERVNLALSGEASDIVGKGVVAEAFECDALEEACRDDTVSVDVVAAYRNAGTFNNVDRIQSPCVT